MLRQRSTLRRRMTTNYSFLRAPYLWIWALQVHLFNLTCQQYVAYIAVVQLMTIPYRKDSNMVSYGAANSSGLLATGWLGVLESFLAISSLRRVFALYSD